MKSVGLVGECYMLVDCFVKLCISICYTALDVYSTSLCLFRLIPNTVVLCGVEWNAYSQSDIDRLCTQTYECSLTVSL